MYYWFNGCLENFFISISFQKYFYINFGSASTINANLLINELINWILFDSFPNKLRKLKFIGTERRKGHWIVIINKKAPSIFFRETLADWKNVDFVIMWMCREVLFSLKTTHLKLTLEFQYSFTQLVSRMCSVQEAFLFTGYDFWW